MGPPPGREPSYALLKELYRQNERFHGDDNAWRTHMDEVVSRLGYSRSESTLCCPGN